ncbi:Ribosomal RNA large subunit methyltransferase G [Roseovarius albus]|uniref:Ribosomal RNA large subunit methyltransferase G n=1 Tax=Roseovarius albus TaxID=1247867 RepID=A0A1X6Z9S5_9RHOB|nr:methyltransferase [Roseovarius albus]SLN45628.1 Ribosomal RNA large subunit methyltransferase G [Roseovarius albus]
MAVVSRLSLALSEGELTLPEVGRIAVFGPKMDTDLSALPSDRCHVLTGFRPDYDHFAGRGFSCGQEPEGRYSLSIVFLGRAKALSQTMISKAAAVTDGLVVIDGAKTDGADSVLKAVRKRAETSVPLSKAHGKLFSFPSGDGFEDWATQSQEVAPGFETLPGVFSADGIDPASKLLADSLPKKLGGQVVDLGGGWGYLSARILEREEVEALHLVEADHDALACARLNISDARAWLHWEDATRWQPQDRVNTVVTNPPFHTGRAASPDLGQAFIRSAWGMLKPQGQLFLVANRHLPYEKTMAALFAHVSEMAGDRKFKILNGQKPLRKPR